LYPIRRSNKPPYIYWKKLVVLGLLLLVITIPLAILSTEVNYAVKFVEHGIITARGRIPRNTPPVNVLGGLGAFVTNLSFKSVNCSLRRMNLTVYGTNRSIIIEEHQGKSSVVLPGITFLSVTLPGGCSVMYTYKIIELSRPYSALVFVSALTSIAGAVMGVLGTVLFIKQRRLMRLEERYL